MGGGHERKSVCGGGGGHASEVKVKGMDLSRSENNMQRYKAHFLIWLNRTIS